MEISSLLLIMAVVWGTGMIFRKLRLPLLLGELLAGLLLGPSLFGIFQDSETIRILAELGIFFLMLHAGLETNPEDLLHSSKKSIAVALGGIILPLALGMLAARAFGYGAIEGFFIGMTLSITAISVTAKVFKDFNFSKSPIAHLVMGAAIADDIVAFLMLSVIIGIVENGGMLPLADIMWIIGKVVLFFGGVIFAGQKLFPLFKNIFQHEGYKAFTFTLVIAFAFGVFAEYIGLHAIFGAYIAGLFVKEEIASPAIYRKIEDRLFGISYSFLGPIFFVSLGFHVDFSIFKEPQTLPFLFAVLAAAIIGKVVGAGGMAYLFGEKLKESAIIGVGMNGRGAVELIIAVIGLELGLINEKIFSILVVMAFFTTLMTPIILNFLLKSIGRKEAPL